MKKLYQVFLGVLALSAVLLSGCAGDNTEPAEGASSDAGQSAVQINFEGTDIEGNTISSDVLSQAKLTMINVWATYCGPCIREMPELGELAEEYDGAEFQIIGIISDVLEGEDQESAENLIERTGANYTHLLLNESIYYALLSDVSVVPTTFFLNENGEILDTVLGAMEKADWEEKIDALLEKQ